MCEDIPDFDDDFENFGDEEDSDDDGWEDFGDDSDEPITR